MSTQRRSQTDRLIAAPGRAKPGYRVRAHGRVRTCDSRIGGAVVAQRGECGCTVALVALRTVAFSVKRAPVAGALVSTVGVSTTRSGTGAAPTVTVTATEQLLVVSDSPVAESTHAP